MNLLALFLAIIVAAISIGAHASVVDATSSSSNEQDIDATSSSALRRRVNQADDAFLPSEKRIVNGKVVYSIDLFPSYTFTAGTTLCGGTLVHDDIVLTAAHCEGGFMAGVFIGGTDLYGRDGDFMSVEEELPHEHFKLATGEHDIMLLKLSDPSTAPLQRLNWDSSVPADNQEVTVIGLGSTQESGSVSQDLLQTDVNIIGFEECDAFYNGNRIKDDTMVCAGSDDGSDSCQGDSGGPLLIQNKKKIGDSLQVGIVSYGKGCGRKNVPAVYTRVSGYKKWIEKGICKLSDVPPARCSLPQANSVLASAISSAADSKPQEKTATGNQASGTSQTKDGDGSTSDGKQSQLQDTTGGTSSISSGSNKDDDSMTKSMRPEFDAEGTCCEMCVTRKCFAQCKWDVFSGGKWGIMISPNSHKVAVGDIAD